jgi:hypothetical protein
MSVQYFASASQKFTWPTVIAVAPALTEDVSVTAVQEVTVVTAPDAEVTASVVVVDVLVCALARFQVPNSAMASIAYHAANRLRFCE